jgi:hypothetical protein
MADLSIFETNPILRQRIEQERENYRQAKPNGFDQQTIIALLSGTCWLTRDIPKPDFLLGELLSTTCRVELVGPTGLGKTNILLAIAFRIADGADFLHWKGSGKPRRVLFIDGEMSRRLAKERLEDATRRHGRMPATLFYFNREDFEDFQPLNTEAGQKYIDYLMEQIGGVDLVIFDNVQALLVGDMKDEEPWQDTLSWVRDLTRRSIGQIWAHHTGHDETRAYGTKTREWQLDSVALLERVEHPGADIAFQMKFTKARERRPDNRNDFEPAVITLADDKWTSAQGVIVRTKPQAKDRALELLKEAIGREGTSPPACAHIPPDTQCVTVGLWRRYCQLGCITEGDERAARKAFERASNALLKAGLIGKWDLWVWIVK